RNPMPENDEKPQIKKEKKGSMTVSEAGKKGGDTVARERGREFYEEIGRKGGETVKAERGREFYEEIGRKGGQKVRALIEQGKRATAKSEATKTEETGAAKPA